MGSTRRASTFELAKGNAADLGCAGETLATWTRMISCTSSIVRRTLSFEVSSSHFRSRTLADSELLRRREHRELRCSHLRLHLAESLLSQATVTVENALYLDKRLLDVSVVPVPDDKLGELVACVPFPCPSPPSLTLPQRRRCHPARIPRQSHRNGAHGGRRCSAP